MVKEISKFGVFCWYNVSICMYRYSENAKVLSHANTPGLACGLVSSVMYGCGLVSSVMYGGLR